MSLKRRNLVAWVLLLAAALCLSVGRQMAEGGKPEGFATTSFTAAATAYTTETAAGDNTTFLPTTMEENDELI